MTQRIRWGLLSTANINDAIIGPIRSATQSELAAVASRDGARAKKYAEQKEIPHAYGSYEDLLADQSIDAIYISLPNALHCEWAVKAAQAGKHILCEKPIAVSLEELDRMEAAARANNVILVEAFMYLHHPQTRRALEIVREGTLGTIVAVQSWFHFYLPPERSTNIRLNAQLSGGSLWDVGVYPNSFAITLIDQGAPHSVYATQTIGESGVDVAMHGQLNFAANAVAQISSSFRTPFREAAYVYGDAGILQIIEPWKPGLQGNDSDMRLSLRDGSHKTISTPAKNPYLAQIEAMEASILHGQPSLVSLQQSREFLQSAIALYQSAQTGKLIHI